jgi:aspartate/methionine/tyrosine aminotransferase
MLRAMHFRPFAMERYQSTFENEVDYNLSESGVHPLSLRELLDMAGESIDDLRLGYGQSNGSRALREHIARLYPGATGNNVMVTNGSAEANFVAMWRLLEAGGEIAIVVPTYMQTYGIAASFSVPVREIPLVERLGWQPDPETIASTIGERTRAIIVTNPSNPTGAVLSDAARRAIIDAAARVGAWILADEVYTGAERTGHDTQSFFGGYPRVIATGSLSKAYGLPGLRIGWVVADEAEAAALWARTDYTTISPGDLTDRLAAIALRDDVRPRIIERTRARIRANLSILDTWMREQGVFRYRLPDAGAICYTHYDLPINSTVLAERLRTRRSVLVVPGDHFAMDGFLRIGFGLPEHELHDALARVAEELATLTVAAE